MANDKAVFTTGAQAQPASKESVLRQIDNISIELAKAAEQESETNNKIFKELFGADLSRGDLVVFPASRLSTYNLFIERLPLEVVKQIRLDRVEVVQEITVINGNYVTPTTSLWDSLKPKFEIKGADGD